MKHEIVYGYFCPVCILIFVLVGLLFFILFMIHYNDINTKKTMHRLDNRVLLSYLLVIILFLGMLLFI